MAALPTMTRGRIRVLCLLSAVSVLLFLQSRTNGLHQLHHPDHRHAPPSSDRTFVKVDGDLEINNDERLHQGRPPPPPGSPPPRPPPNEQQRLASPEDSESPPSAAPLPPNPDHLQWPSNWAHFNAITRDRLSLPRYLDNLAFGLPEASPPPPKYVEQSMEYQKTVKQLNTMITYDESGRPTLIPHDDIYMGPDEEESSSKETENSGETVVKMADVGKGEGGMKVLPKVQFEGKLAGNQKVLDEEQARREFVKRAFVHTWTGYKKYAWGHDELRPVSNTYSNHYNGWGATIVDTLDTLLIMDLSEQYNLAREHVNSLDFTYLAPSGQGTFEEKVPELDIFSSMPPLRHEIRAIASPLTIPTFETIIRFLGGLISAYELSGDSLMLERAVELGDWLLPSMATKEGLAVGRYSLGMDLGGRREGNNGLAEVGTLSMEFTKLTMLTGDEVYYEAVKRSMDTLDQMPRRAKSSTPDERPNLIGRLGTLLASRFDAGSGTSQSEYSFGGEADSYYEYLIKQHQLIGGADPQYGRMYTEAIDSMHEFLVFNVESVPDRKDLIMIGKVSRGRFVAEVQHLTCFAGAMLGLGSKLFTERQEDFEVGVGITNTCHWAYDSTMTGLGPESLMFLSEVPDKARGKYPLGLASADSQYIGRPETIESIWYMWRLTGDRSWQDKGWKMFSAWIEHAMTDSGMASIGDVYIITPFRSDSMESFVLAETFKYYYLLFSPYDLISLDDYVFNTEAHPFSIPIPAGSKRMKSKPLWDNSKASRRPINESNRGKGTNVQKWARIHQTAMLSKAERMGVM